jgi:serine/threonine protein kinase
MAEQERTSDVSPLEAERDYPARDVNGQTVSLRQRQKLDEYEVLETVGAGGMGVIYRARQTGTDRIVALKILPRHLAADETYLARFRREARAAARLNHPNIVGVFGSGQANTSTTRSRVVHYIAMEYVDGESLERLLRGREPLAEPQIVEIALCIARALYHAHGAGVLHRDVKPGNILVTRRGEVKLTDFGMARFGATRLSFQTTAGRVFGTPAFLSPEQAVGLPEVDHRADIYALGCVIYNMAAGRPPFEGDNPFVVIDQHRRAEPVPVRSLNPDISEALAALIARAMAKQPDHRYQDAQQMIWDLELIRQAHRAPDNVHGGLAEIVAAIDRINVVGRMIRQAQAVVSRPPWRMRLTAAFLARPTFWFAAAAAAALFLALAAGYAGYRLGLSVNGGS